MPQFDFFFFYNCIINFIIVFLILFIFINSFLLPVIYKVNYVENVFLKNKILYLSNTYNFVNLNIDSKNLFYINKILSTSVIFLNGIK